MEQHLALRVPGSTAGLRLAADALERFSAGHGIPAAVSWKLQVALDELLSNVVRHGYAGRDDGEIEVRFAFRGGVLSLTVVDSGPRFNPFELPAPRTDVPLEEREPGGLGIALVRSLADEARYEWRDGRNEATVALYLQT